MSYHRRHSLPDYTVSQRLTVNTSGLAVCGAITVNEWSDPLLRWPLNYQAPPLSQVLGDWLDEVCTWDFWCTFTSPVPWSENSWRRMIQKLQANAKFERLFWAIESGSISGRKHAHALVKGLAACPRELHRTNGWSPAPDGSVSDIYSIWRLSRKLTTCEVDGKKIAGRCHVDAFDPGRGAAAYVGKYITKSPLDWDLEMRYHRPGDISCLDLKRPHHYDLSTD